MKTSYEITKSDTENCTNKLRDICSLNDLNIYWNEYLVTKFIYKIKNIKSQY